MGDVFLTREGHEKLMQKLDYLKNVRRRELSRAIEKARAFGDISENAEYDAAKEAQGMNEKEVAQLEEKLSRARIIEDENISSDDVRIGATVRLQDLDTDEELEYMLVSEEEADYSQNKISLISPVGKALLGHKVKEVVTVNVPAGILKYKILNISR